MSGNSLTTRHHLLSVFFGSKMKTKISLFELLFSANSKGDNVESEADGKKHRKRRDKKRKRRHRDEDRKDGGHKVS